MRVLRLPIKGEWLDIIDAGIKKDEYREIKEHYMPRFFENRPNIALRDLFESDLQETTDIQAFVEYWGCTIREYDAVELIAGYSRTSRRSLYEWEGLSVGLGNREWGAPAGKNVFRVHLGKRIEE